MLIAVIVLTASRGIADDPLVESQAIVKIELLGGKVTRDETLTGCPVVGIDFRGSTRVRAGYLHLLRSFKKLARLNLSGSQITDAALKDICQLETIQILELNNTGITDSGL